jgi:hypothetical protein
MKLKWMIILLLTTPSFFAQEIDTDDSFTFEISFPKGITNASYKKIMQGLIQSSAHYQYAFNSGLCLGVGIHYTYFTVNEFRVPSKVKGGIHTPALFMKVGHEKFWTEKFGTDVGVKFGYLQSFTVTDVLKSKEIPYNMVEGTYIEPSLSIILKANVNSSYRLTFGYPIYGYSFTPWMIGIDSILGIDPKEYNKPSSLFSIGFAYTFYFNGLKQQ